MSIDRNYIFDPLSREFGLKSAPLFSRERITRPGYSAPAQRLKNVDLVRRFESRIQPPHLFAVDEDLHVRPDRILLVNHPKAYAGELAIQIVEHFGYARTTRLNVVPLIRVGQQRAWNVDSHKLITMAVGCFG